MKKTNGLIDEYWGDGRPEYPEHPLPSKRLIQAVIREMDLVRRSKDMRAQCIVDETRSHLFKYMTCNHNAYL